MSEPILVKGVMTKDGPGQIDYTALANLPEVPIIDDALNADSTNAIQNKAVNKAVSDINSSLGTLTTTVSEINTSLGEVLGEDGKVANSEKLGGQEPSYYATAESVKSLEDSKAPKDHASSEADYGIGANDKYGHVKLSDDINSESSFDAGIAATPNAVKLAYTRADEAYNLADALKNSFDWDPETSTLTITLQETSDNGTT